MKTAFDLRNEFENKTGNHVGNMVDKENWGYIHFLENKLLSPAPMTVKRWSARKIIDWVKNLKLDLTTTGAVIMFQDELLSRQEQPTAKEDTK